MKGFSRTSSHFLSSWFWRVDRSLLLAFFVLMGIGLLLGFSASPGVAERIGASTYVFIRKQLYLVPAAAVLLTATSMMNAVFLRRVSMLCLLLSVGLLVYTLLKGTEIKGATRWISVAGFSVQPSEFAKPFFAVVVAWYLSWMETDRKNAGRLIAGIILAVFVFLILLQPDVGMSITFCLIWFIQFFLAGLPLVWVFGCGVAGVLALGGAYFIFPHVQSRFDRFLFAETENYQVSTALSAIKRGGFWGVGPGEGQIKNILPDAHTDFILAVAAEEFGLFLCFLIIFLFGFILVRGLSLAFKETDAFLMLASSGLLVQIGVQALINMASTLHLIPTKGMTLPFISYGGSSLLSLSVGAGMLLAFLKKKKGLNHD